MANQIVLASDGGYAALDAYWKEKKIKKLFLVCGASMAGLRISEYFDRLPSRLGVAVEKFSHFKPNPLYESVVEGVALYRQTGCDAIMAVGGGSAMDVAKCIKLYANLDPRQNYLEQPIVPNAIPLLAMPTTAGTGSEATRFAVIYYQGEKQSVADDSCIPSVVLLDPSVLETLPPYQKKATMLDALCHGIESFWSVHSTDQSKVFARQAIALALENLDGYLANESEANANMLQAANLAGKAINITQTTAGHAMSYKLTSLYGISHGHAVALCISKLWPFMLEHVNWCADPRGAGYLDQMFQALGQAMGCPTAGEAASKFQELVNALALPAPGAKEADLELFVRAVNPVRLKNNPIALTPETIRDLYRQILL